jgi:hypothetical protein
MSVHKTPGGSTVISGESVEMFRLVALRSALKLELMGMTSRGASAYSIVKQMGFKGSKKSAYDQLCAYIESLKPGNQAQ